MAADDNAKQSKSGGSILGSLRDALAAAGRDDSGAQGRGPVRSDTAAGRGDHREPGDMRRLDAARGFDTRRETGAMREKGEPGRDVPGLGEDAFAAMKDVTNALAEEGAGTQRKQTPPPLPMSQPASQAMAPPAHASDNPTSNATPVSVRAQDAAREARGGTPNVPKVELAMDHDTPPTTGVVRQPVASAAAAPEPTDADTSAAQTQFVRGRQKVDRSDFAQDPVVGWLVVVGGPGLGAYRPVFEGNNTVGRSATNRIVVDFGDESISNEEQAYVRYDSADRSFLFVPNLAKTNVVSVNEKRPTSAVKLSAMDLITMGRTQLVFVPFCGADFDWSELSELNR